MNESDLERHPWLPFLPTNTKILIMGTFPPQPKRWSMDFFYPNIINDFWRIMGLIFFNDKNALLATDAKHFDIDRIKSMLIEKGIGMGDTGFEIRRLAGNASDKFLEIVTPIPLWDVLSKIPECDNIATTGEKAAGVIASLTGTNIPKVGECVETKRPDGSSLTIWRMPSTSRAYPLAIGKKAEIYAHMFQNIGLI